MTLAATTGSTEPDGRGEPRLVKLNTDLARHLGLDPDELPTGGDTVVNFSLYYSCSES